MNGLFEEAGLEVKWNSPWEAPGKWYKGGFHIHTTMSDGAKTPDGVIDYYRERGFDFVIFSDHGVVTKVPEKPYDDFLCIQGAEIMTGYTARGYSSEYIGIDMQKWPHGNPRAKSPEETRNIMKEQGALIAMCHPGPAYFGQEDDCLYEDCFAVEIYNHGNCVHCGLDDYCRDWDALLERGHFIYGLAGDDAHGYDNGVERRKGTVFDDAYLPNCPSDACGGWNMVKAESFDKKSLMKAFSKGIFFASSGPTITYMGFTDEYFVVECSEAAYIDLKCTFMGFRHWPEKGKLFTRCEFPINNIIKWHNTVHVDDWGNDRNAFFRVEVADSSGRRAWSNPFWVSRTTSRG